MRDKKPLTIILLGIVLFNPLTFSNTTADKVKGKFAWPSLPSTGFIKGRVATKSDVDKRHAVFAYVNGKNKSTPINDIQVPQYGLVKHHDSKKLVPVIVLQAEVVQGTPMIGYLNLSTKKRAVTVRKSVKLLGNKCCPKH